MYTVKKAVPVIPTAACSARENLVNILRRNDDANMIRGSLNYAEFQKQFDNFKFLTDRMI